MSKKTHDERLAVLEREHAEFKQQNAAEHKVMFAKLSDVQDQLAKMPGVIIDALTNRDKERARNRLLWLRMTGSGLRFTLTWLGEHPKTVIVFLIAAALFGGVITVTEIGDLAKVIFRLEG